MKETARHIVFIGRVQGVGFRFTAQRIACRYSLAGFVRNMPNGSVEMFAQGHPDDIDDCLGDLQESFANYIRETKIEDIPSDPRYKEFNITF